MIRLIGTMLILGFVGILLICLPIQVLHLMGLIVFLIAALIIILAGIKQILVNRYNVRRMSTPWK